MTNFLKNQNWRYATKKFDATKKVTTEDLNILKEAIRLSSSSYGLQLYKVIIVENTDLRNQIQPAAYGQSQIIDASHLIVFANQTTVTESDLNGYVENAVKIRSLPEGTLNGYAEFMKGALLGLTDEAKAIWTSKQTYLALGNLLNAAAELQIDVTPMEGFNPALVNEILGLDKLNLNASLLATVGYRHHEDDSQFYAKVRKSNEDLFITL